MKKWVYVLVFILLATSVIAIPQACVEQTKDQWWWHYEFNGVTQSDIFNQIEDNVFRCAGYNSFETCVRQGSNDINIQPTRTTDFELFSSNFNENTNQWEAGKTHLFMGYIYADEEKQVLLKFDQSRRFQVFFANDCNNLDPPGRLLNNKCILNKVRYVQDSNNEPYSRAEDFITLKKGYNILIMIDSHPDTRANSELAYHVTERRTDRNTRFSDVKNILLLKDDVSQCVQSVQNELASIACLDNNKNNIYDFKPELVDYNACNGLCTVSCDIRPNEGDDGSICVTNFETSPYKIINQENCDTSDETYENCAGLCNNKEDPRNCKISCILDKSNNFPTCSGRCNNEFGTGDLECLSDCTYNFIECREDSTGTQTQNQEHICSGEEWVSMGDNLDECLINTCMISTELCNQCFIKYEDETCTQNNRYEKLFDSNYICNGEEWKVCNRLSQDQRVGEFICKSNSWEVYNRRDAITSDINQDPGQGLDEFRDEVELNTNCNSQICPNNAQCIQNQCVCAEGLELDKSTNSCTREPSQCQDKIDNNQNNIIDCDEESCSYACEPKRDQEGEVQEECGTFNNQQVTYSYVIGQDEELIENEELPQRIACCTQDQCATTIGECYDKGELTVNDKHICDTNNNYIRCSEEDNPDATYTINSIQTHFCDGEKWIACTQELNFQYAQDELTLCFNQKWHTKETNCNDELDDGGVEGQFDCQDPTCNQRESCEYLRELTCNDGIDNDYDIFTPPQEQGNIAGAAVGTQNDGFLNKLWNKFFSSKKSIAGQAFTSSKDAFSQDSSTTRDKILNQNQQPSNQVSPEILEEIQRINQQINQQPSNQVSPEILEEIQRTNQQINQNQRNNNQITQGLDCQDSDCRGLQGPTSLCCASDSDCNEGSICSNANNCQETSCSDNIDNDNDGLLDCQDTDCSGFLCGGDGRDTKICLQQTCQAIPKAQQAPSQVISKREIFSYNELFNKLNQCEIVIGTGSCQDICATQEKICIFAQAGEKSCLDSSSTKCTCC